MVANHQGVRDQGGVTRRVRLRAGGRRPTQIFHKVPFSERGHLAARHRDFFPTTAVGHSVTSRHVCCRVQFFRCRLGATTPPLPQLAARSVSAAARSLAAITAAARPAGLLSPEITKPRQGADDGPRHGQPALHHSADDAVKSVQHVHGRKVGRMQRSSAL
jgi:hypothetical protein